jgi:hypothetical protein
MPAYEDVAGLRCTRRTSLFELTRTRLAEGLRARVSLALVEVVTMVRNKLDHIGALVMLIRLERPVNGSFGLPVERRGNPVLY